MPESTMRLFYEGASFKLHQLFEAKRQRSWCAPTCLSSLFVYLLLCAENISRCIKTFFLANGLDFIGGELRDVTLSNTVHIKSITALAFHEKLDRNSKDNHCNNEHSTIARAEECSGGN